MPWAVLPVVNRGYTWAGVDSRMVPSNLLWWVRMLDPAVWALRLVRVNRPIRATNAVFEAKFMSQNSMGC